jgi:hypothetical protein
MSSVNFMLNNSYPLLLVFCLGGKMIDPFRKYLRGMVVAVFLVRVFGVFARDPGRAHKISTHERDCGLVDFFRTFRN